MKITIRIKLIIAISLLVIALFSVAAVLFINEKKTEMADDIYKNALSFAKLTALDAAENYDLYLAENGFIYFNREIRTLFEQNDDVFGLKIVNYSGGLLYDSFVDVDKRYEGEARFIDENVLNQVRSEYISLKTKDGQIFYLDRDSGEYIDRNGRAILPMQRGKLIEFLVVPANEKYSVIYYLDYHNLDERVGIMTNRIIYLAVFGILFGILMSFFMSSRVTKPVKKLVDGANQIAGGDFKTRVEIKTKDEIGFLGEAFNKMAVDLEASVEARIYKERVTHELELAAQIQNQLIPKEIPIVPGVEISSALIPAEEIGGDIYDFLNFEENRLVMYLGDVTGHGIPAGIISSIASALFYGYSEQSDLKNIVVEVNRVLQAKTMPNMFMTLCLMEWNALQKKFKYVSAGHEKLIHYKANEKRTVLTPSAGVALGMLPLIEAHLKVDEINFGIGDFIIVYSDGIPEAHGKNEQNYGLDRLRMVVEKTINQSKVNAEILKNAILNDVKTFMGDQKQRDDITLIVIKRV